MSDDNKPPMVVWLDIEGTSDNPDGRFFWGDWGNRKTPYDFGPYVHLDQFMEELVTRSGFYGKNKDIAAIGLHVMELAKELKRRDGN